MNQLLYDIRVLKSQEKARADAMHGEVKSMHEGFGIVAEEVLELRNETEPMANLMHKLLEGIMHEDMLIVGTAVNQIEAHAVNAAAEAVQVAAVCGRITEYLRERNGKD